MTKLNPCTYKKTIQSPNYLMKLGLFLNISLIHYTAHCCFEMLNFKLSKYSLPNFFQFPQYTYVYVNVADFSNKLQNILQNNTKDRDILQTER
jgi:hypothetical protein